MSLYSDTVLADGPVGYWRLGDGAGPNFVNDPSFESGSLASIQNSWVVATPAELSVDTVNLLSGNSSILCTNTRTGGNNWNSLIRKTGLTSGGATHLFTVTPGQQFFGSLWCKQFGGLQTHCKITWFDALGNGLGLSTPMGGTNGTFDWTYFSSTITAPASSVYGQLAVMAGTWDSTSFGESWENGAFNSWGPYHDTIDVVAGNAWDGKFSLICTNNDTAAAFGAFLTSITTPAVGTSVTASFYFKSQYRARAYLSFVGASDVAGAWTTGDANRWTQASLTTTVPSGTTSIVAYLMFENPDLLGNGKVGYADAYQLIIGTAPSKYYSGHNALIWFDDIQLSPMTVAAVNSGVTGSDSINWLDYRNTVLADQPGAYWRMDDGDVLVSDETLNGNTGTATAGISTRQPGFQKNAQNWSMTSDGNTAHWVSIPNNANFNPPQGQDFSLELWINSTVGAGDFSVLEKWTAAGSYPYVIRWNAGTPTFNRYDGVNNPGLNAIVSVNDGLWHQVVIVTQGKTMKIYTDGVLRNTVADSTTGATSNTDPLTLFNRGGGGHGLACSLDELSFYNYALTDNQILRHYLIGTQVSYNGTIRGTVTLGQTGATSDGDKAMLFDGSTGFVSTASSPFNPSNKSVYSIEAWVKPTVVDTTFRRVCGMEASVNHGTFLYWQSAVGWGFARGDNAAGVDTATGGTPSTSSFSHLVGVYDGTQMRYYVNGVLIATTSSTRNVDISGALFYIGGTQASVNGSATIDEVATYNYVLSASQIAAHYNDGITAWSAPVNGTATKGSGLTSLPRNFDIATTETKSYTVNVSNYLGNTDRISSVNATLTNISTGQTVTSAWQGAITVSGNAISVVINGGVLQLGQTYQLSVTFSANFQKIMTFYSFVNVVA